MLNMGKEIEDEEETVMEWRDAFFNGQNHRVCASFCSFASSSPRLLLDNHQRSSLAKETIAAAVKQFQEHAMVPYEQLLFSLFSYVPERPERLVEAEKIIQIDVPSLAATETA